MGWIPYPTALSGYSAAGGAPYTSAQLNNSAVPQSIRDQMQAAQTAQAAATSTAPYTSGFATGLKALSGYVGGRVQNQADQAAAPYQGGQSEQASPSLLASLLRGDATSANDPTSGQAPATGWGAVGQSVGQAAQAVGRKSDRRLKSEVTRIGELPNGLPVYHYRLEGGPFEIGCMADEVLSLHPGAVWEADDGFLRVDYSQAVL